MGIVPSRYSLRLNFSDRVNYSGHVSGLEFLLLKESESQCFVQVSITFDLHGSVRPDSLSRLQLNLHPSYVQLVPGSLSLHTEVSTSCAELTVGRD